MKNPCYGHTVLEMMLSLMFAMLLMAAISSVYLAIQHLQQQKNAMATIQEHARFLTHYLSERIQTAGYNGCDKSKPTINVKNAVKIYKANALPSTLTKSLNAVSDVIIIGSCQVYHQKNQFLRIAYYVADTHRENRQHQIILAFYEKILGSQREELVPGVTRLTISQASRLISLQLRFQSLDAVLPQQQYLYQPWQIDVALREPLDATR